MNIKVQNGENNDTLIRSTRENHKRRDDKKNGQSENVINASQLNLQDDIVIKKVQAQKKAIKTVMDAFAGEYNIDDMIHSQVKRAEELSKESDNSLKEINRLKDLKTQLKDSYGIADDSQEQKDLELIEKQQRIQSGVSTDTLTEEESTRLSEMGTLTEYQKTALEYDSIASTWQKRLDSTNNQKKSVNMSVESMKIEQVKSHVVVDAEKMAQDIMETASKEIVGMIVDDAKDKIDEKIQKEQQDAKKKADEEKAKQEALNKNKDKDHVNNDAMDQLNQVVSADSAQEKLQKEIQSMIDNQKILGEDIKGLAVDETT